MKKQERSVVGSDMAKLTIVACRLGQEPVIEQMEPGLEAMQAFVGGYIEAVRLEGEYGRAGIDLYCDEEFLLKSYAPNRWVSRELLIHGDFFISGHDDEGETIGLSAVEANRWLVVAKSWPVG